MQSFLQIKNLSKSFNNILVLNNINLTLSEGEQAVLRGPSGSGKSTLMYLIGGLDKGDSGQISFMNKDICQFSDEQLARYRNIEIGFVFQFHYLLSSLNCLENILLPARIGSHDLPSVRKDILNYAKHLDVHNLLKKYPHQLSGGEQQRINLLRAISLKPKLILCDEPTGNLDSINSKKVILLLKELAQETKSALLVVTHDNEVSKSFEIHYHIRDGQFE